MIGPNRLVRVSPRVWERASDRGGEIMTLITGKHMVWGGAGVLLASGVLHSLAWSKVQVGFSPDSRPLAALIWFLLAFDWLVFAAIWCVGAAIGPRARPMLLISASIPVAVVIGLCLTFGPGFYAVYLQLIAAGLLVVGSLRLS